ncbi:L-dopachrome tautomerase-related protein [Komagataeibacter europaeus]|uniref:L-dopachrome tautomerase-related protein n=1 Tax=Komagataeibacter europaeus TaxID=33995 RepID=UPI00031CD2EB|nr:L-dopachrome tautomerase-related protein [Komagataeibacter europaeus]
MYAKSPSAIRRLRSAGFLLACGTCLLGAGHAAHAAKPAPPLNPPAALEEVASSSTAAWDRVVVLPDGRLLVELPRWAGNTGPGLALVDGDNTPHPYPDNSWNDPATPAASRLVAPSDIQLQPDGTLWVLDSGQPDPAGKPVDGGPKIVKIDSHTGQVMQTWPLNPGMLRAGSYAATMRIARGHAFIGDSGIPAMIVVRLDTNIQRRLMEHTPALTAHQPITVDGKVATNPAGHTAIINISQMDISADGQWLYFEPLCGPVYKLDTDLLVDPKVTPIELEEGSTLWYKTPPLGGITAGPDGTLYFNDVSTGSIFRLMPDRVYQKIVTDPRLHWPGGSFATRDGQLYVPASQLDRTAPLNGGHNAIQWPVHIYRINIGSLPPPKF